MVTKLMNKLFSDDTPVEYKERIAEKVEEAKKNGSSEFIEGEEKLQFADTGDDRVVVEDQVNDEVTEFIPTEDGFDMEAVEIPAEEVEETKVESEEDPSDEDKKEFEEGFKSGEEFQEGKEAAKNEEIENAEETKTESETQPEVKVEKVEGKDGEHVVDTVPEVTVNVDLGIDDKEKAGLKSFSATFRGATPEYIAAVQKAFADVAEKMIEEESKEIEEDLDDISAEERQLVDNVNELAKAADDLEETKDKELAKAVKEMSAEVEKMADEVDCKKCDVSEVKAQCKNYSELADRVLAGEDEVKDKPEEVENKPEDKVEEVAEEHKKDLMSDEAQRSFSACLGNFDDASLAPQMTAEESRIFSIPESKEESTNKFLDTIFD